MVTVILNIRPTTYIAFHGVLHGFREDCRTRTASLETKLIQQLTNMRKEVLYAIFLELHKAYVTLYRERCLYILEGYIVGLQDRRILHN